MDDKRFDELLSGSLKQGTDAASGMKRQVWEAIEKKVIEHEYYEQKASNELGVSRVNTYGKRKKQGKGRLILAAAAAAVLLISFITFSTETGQAFISQIRQMFEPEKKVVEEIEGMEEETDTRLHEHETADQLEADYIIYVDEERYSVSKDQGVHRIEAKIDDDRYPPVYMEITQDVERSPNEIAEELYQQLTEEFPTVHEIEEVSEPVQGLRVRALAGQEWDSEVIVYYVLSNEKEGSFIFKQAYFLEASEGHGARMHHMLEQFQIVELEK